MAVASDAAQAGWALHRARMVVIADWLAVGVVVAMPWSTSLFQIFIVLWLIALLPTLDVAAVRRELQTPAGALPVLLWFAGVLGMLWASVPWLERIEGLGDFHKLLAIPLLLAQFRRSPRGWYVVSGFLLSCSVLLAASFAGWLLKIGIGGKAPGFPVREYIAQSTEFMICIFALLALAVDWWRKAQWRLAAAAALLSALFLANILLVATGRTALVVIPLLLLLLGYRAWGWKGVLAGCVAASLIGAMAWTASPFLRHRLTSTLVDVQAYQADSTKVHSAVRIEFWRKSLAFVAEAPVLGHGTGSIRAKFTEAASGQGVTSVIAENPHNQVFAVAIQLGMFGAAILMTMWVAHLALFRGGGLVAWMGVVVVVQNVVSSIFNSHLFDSFHGWLYVFAFSVLAGMMLRGEKDPPMKALP
jgi:O-antigen ligase